MKFAKQKKKTREFIVLNTCPGTAFVSIVYRKEKETPKEKGQSPNLKQKEDKEKGEKKRRIKKKEEKKRGGKKEQKTKQKNKTKKTHTKKNRKIRKRTMDRIKK